MDRPPPFLIIYLRFSHNFIPLPLSHSGNDLFSSLSTEGSVRVKRWPVLSQELSPSIVLPFNNKTRTPQLIQRYRYQLLRTFPAHFYRKFSYWGSYYDGIQDSYYSPRNVHRSLSLEHYLRVRTIWRFYFGPDFQDS